MRLQVDLELGERHDQRRSPAPAPACVAERGSRSTADSSPSSAPGPAHRQHDLRAAGGVAGRLDPARLAAAATQSDWSASRHSTSPRLPPRAGRCAARTRSCSVGGQHGPRTRSSRRCHARSPAYAPVPSATRPLTVQVAQRLGRWTPRRRPPPGRLADDDLAGLGEGLQPGRDVDRVAHRVEAAQRLAADVADQRRAGVGADPEARPVRARPCGDPRRPPRCIASAARTARSAWSGCRAGALNSASSASPTNCTTVPPLSRMHGTATPW